LTRFSGEKLREFELFRGFEGARRVLRKSLGINALPDPLFKYFSKAITLKLVANAMHQINSTGLVFSVAGT
jgi:hypothetical protein